MPETEQTTFGTPPTPPHERAAAAVIPRTVKSHAQPGNSGQLTRPAAPRFAIVDLEREQAIQVLHSTMVFRPNQKLHPVKDARLIQVAEDNGIPLRYRE
jgi:hypothetical protein